MSYFPTRVPWEKYRSILVTGMGGGCDVFTAHTLALSLRSLPTAKQGNTRVFFGNCVGFRQCLSRHEKVKECLYKLGSGNPLEKGKQYWGEIGLEESLYDEKEPEFGPYLSVVMHKIVSPSRPTVADVTRENTRGLLEGWQGRFDLIIAVDNGGDSLTGGIDFHEHVELGRDTQVSLALRQFQTAGLGEYLHVVMGPGCDGESTIEALQIARDNLTTAGQYVGSADLTPLLDETFSRTEILGPTRTPNVMYNAAKLLQNTPLKEREGVMMEVPRGTEPYPRMPAQWLSSAWIFQHAPYCADLRCYEQAPCPTHSGKKVDAKL